jgi:hypothetical protein
MKDPDASGFAPPVMDFEQRYRAKLNEVEEKDSTMPTARAGSTYLMYKFTLYGEDNIAVLDEDGNVYEQVHTCGTQTGYSKPPYIGSRELAEALVGKQLTSEDVREHLDDWEDWLEGKWMRCDVMEIVDEKTGNKRIRIVRVLPDRSRQNATAAAPQPAPAAAAPNGHAAAAEPAPVAPEGETKAQKAARLRAEMEALEAVE